ncbi:MAG: hypothetical protein MUC47_08780 [Candidatus Kapabacteria bacterium]|jgi:hypothetical protein|nr:hypothetical protein [Candidatus Kapabacteria bacterium]
MMLDVLISRYLDGELTPNEDDQLRSMLAADPSAREAFDSAVLLHIAMRCEDDADVPSDELDAVRLMVHDRMMASPLASMPHEFTPSTRKGPWRPMKTATALLAALVTVIVPISHTVSSLRQGMPERVASIPDARTDMAHRLASVGPRPLATSDQERLPNDVPVASTVDGAQIADGAPMSMEGIPASAMAPASDTHVPTLAVLMDQPLQRPVGSLPSTNPPGIEMGERRIVASVDVILTSTVGMGIGGSQRTEEAVTQIAQSLGYGFDRKTQVGIEVGATAYSRVIEHNGLASNAGLAATIANGGSVLALTMMLERDRVQRLDPPVPNEDKIADPVHGGGAFDNVRFTSLAQTRSMWGAAFVQRTVVSASVATVSARVGAGASQDGMIGYGRLHAEVNVLPAVSVSLGGEARLLPYRSGTAIGGSGTTAGTLFSLLYGVNVRL